MDKMALQYSNICKELKKEQKITQSYKKRVESMDELNSSFYKEQMDKIEFVKQQQDQNIEMQILLSTKEDKTLWQKLLKKQSLLKQYEETIKIKDNQLQKMSVELFEEQDKKRQLEGKVKIMDEEHQRAIADLVEKVALIDKQAKQEVQDAKNNMVQKLVAVNNEYDDYDGSCDGYDGSCDDYDGSCEGYDGSCDDNDNQDEYC